MERCTSINLLLLFHWNWIADGLHINWLIPQRIENGTVPCKSYSGLKIPPGKCCFMAATDGNQNERKSNQRAGIDRPDWRSCRGRRPKCPSIWDGGIHPPTGLRYSRQWRRRRAGINDFQRTSRPSMADVWGTSWHLQSAKAADRTSWTRRTAEQGRHCRCWSGVVELDWPKLVEPQTDGPLVGTIINYK